MRSSASTPKSIVFLLLFHLLTLTSVFHSSSSAEGPQASPSSGGGAPSLSSFFGGRAAASQSYGGGAAPPSVDGVGATTPSSGGGGAASRSTDGVGAVAPSSGGGGTAAPLSGTGGAAVPSYGGGTATPSSGGGAAAPSSDGVGPAKPSSGGVGATSLSSGAGGAATPSSAGGAAASSSGGAAGTPSSGAGGAAPPSSDGGAAASSPKQQQPSQMTYHHGILLSGSISINPIFYGTFQPTQRAIITDFLNSLTSDSSQPSVASWWKTIDKYYAQSNNQAPSFSVAKEIVEDTYSLGKSLNTTHLVRLAWKGQTNNAINIVLTASDVAVEGFCSGRCGTHGSAPKGSKAKEKGVHFTYIWVGNSESQCPGQCAWPFHKPVSGPQTPPLVPPNNDVGIDGMIINLATLLAGTVTNPYGKGFYQGENDAPLEAASACPGIFGKGSYPGNAGELSKDSGTGASYNANGTNGRKYLLPALFDPSSSSCVTLP